VLWWRHRHDGGTPGTPTGACQRPCTSPGNTLWTVAQTPMAPFCAKRTRTRQCPWGSLFVYVVCLTIKMQFWFPLHRTEERQEARKIA
jgi:hypothetical protein